MYITDYENNLSNTNMKKRNILALWANFWNRPYRPNRPNNQNIQDNSEKPSGLEDDKTEDIIPDEALNNNIIEENDEDEYDEEEIDDEENTVSIGEPVSKEESVSKDDDKKEKTEDEITFVIDGVQEKSNNTIDCIENCDINNNINGTSLNENIYNDKIFNENPSIDNNDINSNNTINIDNSKNIKNNGNDKSNLNCTISVILVIVALAVVGGCLFIKRLKRIRSSGKEDLSIVVEYDADKDVSMTEDDKQNNYRIIQVDELEDQESVDDNDNENDNDNATNQNEQNNDRLYFAKQNKNLYEGHKVINALHDINAFHDIIFDSKTIITFVSTDVVESNLDLDESVVDSTV